MTENELNTEPAKDRPLDPKMNFRVITIRIEQIVDVEQTQIREKYSEETLEELTRIWKLTQGADVKIEPILVILKPNVDYMKFWIIDGHHRYKAAVKAGVKELKVHLASPKLFKVRNTDELNFLQARENAETRANRTKATKYRQVEAVLKDHHHWTNNQIAQYCTVSSAFVKDVREGMESIGRIPTYKKPKEKAVAAVADHKNDKKSNRELAKEVGVDEKTIREVRKNSILKNSAPVEAEAVDDPDREALDRIATKANDWLENHEPQQRPTLNKVTAETRRVVPEVEKTTERVIRSGIIRLKDVENISQVVEDVYNWLGDRAEAFEVLFSERLKNKS